MTIEIEAGASQSQFSMKPLVVHAFSAASLITAGYPRPMQICRSRAVREETDSFSKETPSLSLRLRSVQAVRD